MEIWCSALELCTNCHTFFFVGSWTKMKIHSFLPHPHVVFDRLFINPRLIVYIPLPHPRLASIIYAARRGFNPKRFVYVRMLRFAFTVRNKFSETSRVYISDKRKPGADPRIDIALRINRKPSRT